MAGDADEGGAGPAPAADATAPAPAKSLPPLLLARLAKRGIVAAGGSTVGAGGAIVATPPDHPPPPPAPTLPPALVLHPASLGPPLPPGVFAAWSSAFRVPFFFSADGSYVSWTPPGVPPPRRNPAYAALAPGWDVGVDLGRGGAIYYYSMESGERTWARPGGGGVRAAAAPPASAAAAPSLPPFTPADAFSGARPGYVFTMGARGLGYYADGGGGGVEGVGTQKAAARPSIGPAGPAPAAGNADAASVAASRSERARAAGAADPAARRAPGAGRGRGRAPPPAGRDDVDPMDPAAYSDAPAGGWGRGLEEA